jgi:hypothetical protein
LAILPSNGRTMTQLHSQIITLSHSCYEGNGTGHRPILEDILAAALAVGGGCCAATIDNQTGTLIPARACIDECTFSYPVV